MQTRSFAAVACLAVLAFVFARPALASESGQAEYARLSNLTLAAIQTVERTASRYGVLAAVDVAPARSLLAQADEAARLQEPGHAARHAQEAYESLRLSIAAASAQAR